MNSNVTILPGSDEWRAIITPSKVAAILGVSRWESAYRLWHRMKGLVDPEPPKDIFDIGHDFEPAAANRWVRKNPGWRLSRGEVQIVADPQRFGFPVAATLDRRATRGRARRVVEFKTARKLEEWGDELTDECPEDYAAQVMSQMLFTGWTRYPGHLLVLTPWFDDHIYEIRYDGAVADWIVQRCREFWESLSGDEPPELDDTVATYECVRAMHPDIDRGVEVQLDAKLACSLLDWDRDYQHAEKRVRGFKSQVLDAMGNAQYAKVGDLLVADRRPHGRGGVALTLARKNTDQLIEEHHDEYMHYLPKGTPA
ncbi:MAG: YqaJ viral recombinase family protein [Mycobacterium kyogaense]|uniref:YqaJ viral recombinase family protein n=1 Tax=Mycobacterium kyogaense TaxID=2212479 RepID=UPI002FF7B055